MSWGLKNLNLLCPVPPLPHTLHSPHLYTSGGPKAHMPLSEASQQRELALNLLSSNFRTCGVVIVLLMRTLVMEP